MITINLTPVEELEDPQWWVPDLAILLLILVVSMGSVLFYIATIENEIAEKEAEKVRLIAETQAMSSEVDRFNGLNEKIEKLGSKKNSLKRITDSKLVRFLPIILLENIQILKPKGVWLTSVGFVDKKNEIPVEVPQPAANSDPNKKVGNEKPTNTAGKVSSTPAGTDYPFVIEIAGSAVDNMQIAEFMISLKATQNQVYEKADLRTQLFFSDVAINFSQISTQKDAQNGEGKEVVSFKLQLNSREREGKDGDNSGRFSQFIDEFRRDGHAVMN